MNLRIRRIIAIIAILAFLAPRIELAKGIDTLENARDVLSNSSLNTIAQHNISFTLPVYSPAINFSDYIILDLQSYSNVNEPTYINGNYTGTPVFTLIGSRIRITGIRVTPGTTISVRGINAINPPDFSLFDIWMTVSTDADGLNIKNQAHVIAAATNGSIMVTSNIEANVGTLRISGYGSPGMFITFTEDGTVIGTTSAYNDGAFSQIIPGMAPAFHRIQIFGSDSSNRMTPTTTSVEVYTRIRELTTVSGILLPPTILFDKNEISRSEPITVSGRGTPGYKAIIMAEPPVQSYEVIVDGNGDYNYVFNDTTDYELGDHKVSAMLQDEQGATSFFSFNLFFKVVDSTTPPDTVPCDISRGDLNCDSNVNLADFSILLYFWTSDSALADINEDKIVNLIDFSIMMFYWQT